MFSLETFTVLPTTPEKLKPLLDIANNLWFSWNYDALTLFEKLDPEEWKECGKNPTKMLCNLTLDKLETMAQNEDYVSEVNNVHASFRQYMESKSWYEDRYGKKPKGNVAYFSCEYGLHESLPIYSGGLGILAGDHLKSSSDLGVPMVAMGLLYKEGYFKQGLDEDGIQQEFYQVNDWFSMPVTQVKNDSAGPLTLSMNIGAEKVDYHIWKVQVGRIPLYLLDTNLKSNSEKAQTITKRLYVADRDNRLRQEILLGIGGVRALRKLGHRPSCYHINEGHSAFLILERIRTLMKNRALTFSEAKEIVWSSNVFTTHTPVPAGNEHFKQDLLKKYLASWVEDNLKITFKEFIRLGTKLDDNSDEEFCLTILALKFSSLANGVSKLHGQISRSMWKNLWPKLPKKEIPIGHITNGVHTTTWISRSLEKLLARYTPTSYLKEIADFSVWKIVEEVPDHTLWKHHKEKKLELIDYARKRMAFQLKRRGANANEINRTKDILDPEILTIGFARRFAPYKRGALIFFDIDKLEELVTNSKRPVQFIFAGKAHPADEAGKKIIKDIVDATLNNPKLLKRVVFLEDYDISMARYLVQGVDIWLNTPRRPLEASGTSGMKAAMNGAPNMSILDGWWDEAYDSTHGWAIGHGEVYNDLEHQDEVESKLIYRLIEKEAAPLYYDKDEESGLPISWIQMMKKTIKSCGANFNAHRMVTDYIDQYYTPAEQLHKTMTENNCAEAKKFALLHSKLEQHWNDLEIMKISKPEKKFITAGDKMAIQTQIKLGKIGATEIKAEVIHGNLSIDGKIKNPQSTNMDLLETSEEVAIFKAEIPCNLGGRYAYTIRVLPSDINHKTKFLPNLILWHH